jgi:predicted chitinase
MIKRLLPSWDLYSKKDPENGMQFTLTDRRAYDKPENKMGEMGEAFNQPYKTKSEKSEYGDIDMLAKLPDGSNLSIMFIQDHDDDGEEVTQVEFWRNNSQEVTGEGDAQRIFATVLAAIQKYIKKHKPQRLSFSASKEVDPSTYYGPDDVVPNPESRAKLYDRLVQRYAKAWGYRAFRADTGKLVRYELSRLQPAVAEDISRRGFLGGLAGTAVGLAATDAEAGKKKSAAHDKNAKAMNTKIDPKYQLAPGDDLPVLSNNPRVEIAVQKAAKAHGITQPAELAQFMAQTNHESWDFSKLFQVGDKRVYGGKGLIQLTGKNNYAAASKYAGVDLVKHPEQAAKLDVALKVAIWFWKQEVRRYAKTPEHFLNTKLITRIVNGPDMNGLQDREEKFKRYLSIL